jgi:hypothetical protein
MHNISIDHRVKNSVQQTACGANEEASTKSQYEQREHRKRDTSALGHVEQGQQTQDHSQRDRLCDLQGDAKSFVAHVSLRPVSCHLGTCIGSELTERHERSESPLCWLRITGTVFSVAVYDDCLSAAVIGSRHGM